MLFARAISNGVKWFCPDVFAGPVYVPEEMPEQTIEDVPHVVVIEEKPIPTLNDKQIAKLLESGLENIEKYLNLIEEGKLNATQVQVLNLEDKLKELRNE
jgi:hypothetical protein